MTGEELQPTLIRFSPSMLRDIEDFKFRERLPSRTEAVRVLIERGLQVAGKTKK